MKDVEQYEYAVVSKSGGRVLKTFWATPVTQYNKARKLGHDLRRVDVVKIYPIS